MKLKLTSTQHFSRDLKKQAFPQIPLLYHFRKNPRLSKCRHLWKSLHSAQKYQQLIWWKQIQLHEMQPRKYRCDSYLSDSFLITNRMNKCRVLLAIVWYPTKDFNYREVCGSMLVMEPNAAWLLVTVLVAIVFVTTTLAFGCLLCRILQCPRCVWKIHGVGLTHFSRSSSDSQVIWVAWLSSKSNNWENPLFDNNKSRFYSNTFIRL